MTKSSFTFGQVMNTCHNYGMTENDQLCFMFLLLYPNTPEGVTKHSQWSLRSYMALRELGLDDDQIVKYWEVTKP